MFFGNINISSKKFNGININSYNISMPDKYKMEKFDDKIIYESLIYNNSNNYKKVAETIKKDGIKISNLVGNNGIIAKQEFKIN